MTAEPLEVVGIIVSCAAAAAAVVVGDSRIRAAALLVALIAAPLLVAGNVWDEPRIVDLRDSPLQLAGGALAGIVLLVGGVFAFERWPQLFPLAAIAALPLRVPIEIGGETANLLVPLYVVIAAATVASARGALANKNVPPASSALPPGAAGSGGRRLLPGLRSPTGALRWLLAATLVLYAVQSTYSRDVSNAIENIGFFLAPFAALLVLLAEIEWSRELLRRALIAVAAVAAICALIGLGQFVVRDLFLNPELFDANQLHQYFRVNSIFFDPNIFGRYMALAIAALGACIAWEPGRRDLGLALVAAGICLAGLAFSFSITSFAAVIAGLAVVAILRWAWTGLIASLALGAAGLAALLIAGGTPSSDIQSDRFIDAGHTSLIEGGLDLFEDRPVAGHGSGGFGRAFYEDVEQARTTVSHSEPVTVAAEQGVIGVLVYAALLAAALWTVLAAGVGDSLARTAIAGCFVAMLVHSLGYAGFATDPATWALLGLATALNTNVPPASSNTGRSARLLGFASGGGRVSGKDAGSAV